MGSTSKGDDLYPIMPEDGDDEDEDILEEDELEPEDGENRACVTADGQSWVKYIKTLVP